MSSIQKHILLIRMSAMGDVAMTVPVLRVLMTTYPNLKITVVTRGLFKAFFDGIPRVEIFVPDLKSRHKGLLGLLRLSKDLRKKNIDAVADLHDVLRSRILSFFLKRKGIDNIKINKGRSEKKALVQKIKKELNPLKTTHQRYADVFEQLGYPIDLNHHQYPEIEDISPKTNNLLELLFPKINQAKAWIGIAPFAKHKGKAYPIDLMEEVIEQLATKNRVILLFGGGEKETKLLQKIDNQYDNVINVAQKITITEELRLMKKLDVMISMDSANMHMASIVGTRVVSLWGATHPCTGFYGYGQKATDAFLPDYERYPWLPSSIYGNIVFKGYEDCMRSIEPEQVVNHIESILNAG